MIFKRATTAYGKTPHPETSYQKAAQVWDERIGSARVQAKNWASHGVWLPYPILSPLCRGGMAGRA